MNKERKEKIEFLKKISRGQIPVEDLQPPRIKILIGRTSTNDKTIKTTFFKNDVEISDSSFSEYTKTQKDKLSFNVRIINNTNH